VVVILISGFFEWQTYLLYDRFQPAEKASHPHHGLDPEAAVCSRHSRPSWRFVGRAWRDEKRASEAPGQGFSVAAFCRQGGIYVACRLRAAAALGVYLQLSYWGIEPSVMNAPRDYSKTPEWLVYSARTLLGFEMLPIAKLYVALAAPMLAAAFFLRPNSNSLLPLSDRLSKAFLFRRDVFEKRRRACEAFLKLSYLSEHHQPYHLVKPRP